MKKRYDMQMVLVFLFIAALAACSGGGGGGDSSSPAATYTISGTITVSGGGALSGCTMNLTGVNTATVTTNASGVYTFNGLLNGAYTVTPAKSDYTFSPTNLAVSVSGADATGQNFTATAITYSISGTANDKTSGTPMPGVSVSAINAGPSNGVVASTTTDSSGNFTLSVPPNVDVYGHLTYTGYVNKNTEIVTLSGPVTGVSINMFTEAQGVSIVHGFNQCASATTWSDSCIQSMTWFVFGAKIDSGSTNAAGVTISVSPSGPTIGYNNASGVYNGSSTVTSPGGLPAAAGYSSSSAVYSFTATNGVTTRGPIDMRLIPGEVGGYTFSGF